MRRGSVIRMFERAYRALGSFLWRTSIGLIVLVAIVVSLATALVPLLPAVNTSLVAEIEARTGFDAQVVEIRAEMEGFDRRSRFRVSIFGIRRRRRMYFVPVVFRSRLTHGAHCCSDN